MFNFAKVIPQLIDFGCYSPDFPIGVIALFLTEGAISPFRTPKEFNLLHDSSRWSVSPYIFLRSDSAYPRLPINPLSDTTLADHVHHVKILPLFDMRRSIEVQPYP